MHLLFQMMRLTSPEASSGDDDDVGPVGQAIQACRGQQGFAEQVGPLLQGSVAGEQDAAPLVPLVTALSIMRYSFLASHNAPS